MSKTKKFIVRNDDKKEIRLRTYTVNDDAKFEVQTEEIMVEAPGDSWKDGNLISDLRVCDLITVKSVIYKIPEKDSQPEVEFVRENDRGQTTFRMPKAVVGDVRKFGEELAKNHILLKESNQRIISDYFRSEIDEADRMGLIQYEHTPLGFYEHNGKTVFLGENTQLDKNSYSSCVRDFGKFTAGSEAEYDEMLEKVVFTSTKLSLAYVLGFTGVLAAKLYGQTNVIVPIWGFNNSTSTGKTTAVMLSASVFADPSLENGSLMIKTDSSTNGQNAQMADIKGLPFVFDDIDTDGKKDISSTLYRLASGMPRVVANVKGGVLKRGAWRGTVLITSETSLLDRIKKSGIFARYCEFKDIVWTSSAEESDYIQEVISTNFGWKGWKFGEHVAQMDTKTILAEFNKCKTDIFKSFTKTDALSSRISSKYALILLTAKMLNNFFNINLDLDEIMNFITTNEAKNLVSRNKVQASYEYLYDFFNSHRKNFNITYSDNTTALSFGQTYGDAVYRNGNRLYLKIRCSMLEEIMNNAGFTQYHDYAKEWNKKGYVEGDTGRNTTTSKKLGRFYKLVYKLEDVFPDVEDDTKLAQTSQLSSTASVDDEEEIDKLFEN